MMHKKAKISFLFMDFNFAAHGYYTTSSYLNPHVYQETGHFLLTNRKKKSTTKKCDFVFS